MLNSASVAVIVVAWLEPPPEDDEAAALLEAGALDVLAALEPLELPPQALSARAATATPATPSASRCRAGGRGSVQWATELPPGVGGPPPGRRAVSAERSPSGPLVAGPDHCQGTRAGTEEYE